MSEPLNPVPVGRLLRDLLEGDRTLSPTERKLLEVLLLHPPPATARDLSRATSTNLQALYGALDRLTNRGLVVAQRDGATTRFRVAHPSVVLHALVEPGVQAAERARLLEVPLKRLYERDELEPSEAADSSARSTTSATAAASWLLDLLASSRSEVWILGDDAVWFASGSAVEAELARRAAESTGGTVRMLVPPSEHAVVPNGRHARLARAGVAVRLSPRFSAPTVILDRKWVMIVNEAPPGPRASYLRLEAPAFCSDLVASAEEVWNAGVPLEVGLAARNSAAHGSSTPPSRPVSR